MYAAQREAFTEIERLEVTPTTIGLTRLSYVVSILEKEREDAKRHGGVLQNSKIDRIITVERMCMALFIKESTMLYPYGFSEAIVIKTKREAELLTAEINRALKELNVCQERRKF